MGRERKTRLSLDVIVGEAARLCDEVGVERLSLSALADRLGVRSPSLYHYIKNLDDLYTQLTIKGLTDLTQAIEERVASGNDSGPAEAIAIATRQFAKKNPTLFYYTTQSTRLSKADTQRYGKRIMEITSQALEQETGGGEKNETAQYLLRALTYGFIAMEISGALEPATNIDQLYQRILEIVEAGIRATAAT